MHLSPSQHTEHYLAEAQERLRKAEDSTRPPPVQVPPRLLKLVQLQIKEGEEKGQWKNTLEFRDALGGLVPKCPDGMPEYRWCCALALAFFRRQPEWYSHTVSSYRLGERWIDDDYLLDLARTSLPPLPAEGSWGDFLGGLKDEGSAEKIVADGGWQDAIQDTLKNRGYMAFTKTLKSPTRGVDNYGISPQQNKVGDDTSAKNIMIAASKKTETEIKAMEK